MSALPNPRKADSLRTKPPLLVLLRQGAAPRSSPTPKAERAVGKRESVANAAVVLTCGPAEETVPTADPCDAAHGVQLCGLLLPATDPRVAAQATRRRYPRHQLTSRGVAWDSAFDAVYARERMLCREGVLSRSRPSLDEVCAYAQAALGEERRLRDVLERTEKGARLRSAEAVIADFNAGRGLGEDLEWGGRR